MSATPAVARQREIIDFLGQVTSYEPVPEQVERLETHGALVFLAGDFAYKIKKDVQFTYMDFSTLEKRHRVCRRELEINKPHAPDIYLDVVAITRGPDGRLTIGGEGDPVEWCLRMRRFPQSDLLSTIADNGELEPGLCQHLADAIDTSHRAAPVAMGLESAARIAEIAGDIGRQLAPHGARLGAADIEAFGKRTRAHLDRLRPLLEQRSTTGFVRRVHGDLHLGNIVLWKGAPVLFDAIEFDEDIATIDTLYDLAFLLMDLDHRGQRRAANQILNRYLWHSRDLRNLEALAALPLFLALRAGVRSMVILQRALQEPIPARAALLVSSKSYFQRAVKYFEPDKAALIAVGGLSGTGKSTLAAALAPHVGAAPGAVHLRSDLERKAMFDAEETAPLPASTYTPEISARVYAVLHERAEAALRAGQAVIVDAVFAGPGERKAAEDLARRAGVAFHGLWLEAPAPVLRDRVSQRRNDASDATVEVVDKQLNFDTGPISWVRLSSEGSRSALLTAALAALPARVLGK